MSKCYFIESNPRCNVVLQGEMNLEHLRAATLEALHGWKITIMVVIFSVSEFGRGKKWLQLLVLIYGLNK